MNKGIIVGRLVRNPELVQINNGKSIVKITLATDNSKDDTTFLSITIFNKMAEVVNKYCRKGDVLGIEYVVKNHNWQDKSGIKHYDYQFIANRVSFIAKSNNKTTSETQKTQQDNTDVFAEFGKIVVEDNDLPFD